MNNAPLTREDVRLAYRFFFGREPENDSVVDMQLANNKSLASLRRSFLQSEEFQIRSNTIGAPVPAIAEIARGYYGTPGKVDHDVDDAIAERLAQRTREQWVKLGETDPYWSVLTDDRYRSSRIDAAALADFKASGEKSASLVELTAARTGLPVPTGTCLELGCGVGRITRFLAKRFERVIAVDISPGNLNICQRYMADEGVANVTTHLVTELADFERLPTFDYFYSMIVLQHNSPPVQRRILAALLHKVRPGGQCLFQTVADQPGYTFDVQRYLATPHPELEMHSLPMAAITAIMRDKGMVLDLARLDPWTGFYGSYTFAGHREG